MSDTFDFGDGNGPVPAHKHPNGGGWVADTAYVADTVTVGPFSQVYGNAKVSGHAAIFDHAKVFGNALVGGTAQIIGSSKVFGKARVFWDSIVYGGVEISSYRDAIFTPQSSICKTSAFVSEVSIFYLGEEEMIEAELELLSDEPCL